MGDAYGIDLSNIEKSAKVEHALWYLLSNELRWIELSFDGKWGEEKRNLAQNGLSVSLTEWAKERADQRKLILEEGERIESLIEEQIAMMEEQARREYEKEDIYLASMLHQDCEEIWRQVDLCYERLIELQLQKDQLKFSEDQSKLDEILKEESALKAKLAWLRAERRALLWLDN